MKSVLYVAAWAGLAITAAPASAVDLYAGAALGQFYSTQGSLSYDGNSFIADSQDHATPAKAYFGVDLTSRFGLEVGYKTFGATHIAFGDAKASTMETDAHASYVAAKGMLPLGENWVLSGKLGVTQRHFGYSAHVGGQSFSDSVNQSVLYSSVGAAYQLTKSVALTAELEHFGEAQVQNAKLGMDGLSAGVQVRF